MIAKLKQLFEKIDFKQVSNEEVISPEVAVATLLVEVMLADHELAEQEKAKIEQLLVEKFELTKPAVNTVFKLAETEAKLATDYYKFTRIINDNFEIEEKIELVGFLWQVAKADGTVDAVEEHVIRRIADLLHLRHAEYIQAKHID